MGSRLLCCRGNDVLSLVLPGTYLKVPHFTLRLENCCTFFGKRGRNLFSKIQCSLCVKYVSRTAGLLWAGDHPIHILCSPFNFSWALWDLVGHHVNKIAIWRIRFPNTFHQSDDCRVWAWVVSFRRPRSSARWALLLLGGTLPGFTSEVQLLSLSVLLVSKGGSSLCILLPGLNQDYSALSFSTILKWMFIIPSGNLLGGEFTMLAIAISSWIKALEYHLMLVWCDK